MALSFIAGLLSLRRLGLHFLWIRFNAALLEAVFECILEAANRQTVLLVARFDTEIVVSRRQGRFQMQLWVHNVGHNWDALPVKRPHLQRLLDVQTRIAFIAVEGCFTFVS